MIKKPEDLALAMKAMSIANLNQEEGEQDFSLAEKLVEQELRDRQLSLQASPKSSNRFDLDHPNASSFSYQAMKEDSSRSDQAQIHGV